LAVVNAVKRALKIARKLALSSDRLGEAQLYDYGIYRLRQTLAPIHGVTLPTPAGGKYRQIMARRVAPGSRQAALG
jgi:hypothetical protein